MTRTKNNRGQGVCYLDLLQVMKGGRWSRFWGRQYSYTLVALVITTILLWSWEENPVISSISDEGQFLKTPPG